MSHETKSLTEQPKGAWFWGLTAVLGMLLIAGCSTLQFDSPEARFDRADLIGLNGKPLFGEGLSPLTGGKSGNCAMHQIDVPGEGIRFAGGTGGLGLVKTLAFPKGIDPSLIYSWDKHKPLRSSSVGDEPVALLVVDDFNGKSDDIYDTTLERSVYALGNNVFNLSSSDLTGKSMDDVIGTLETTGQFSHGALVLHHVLSLLGALPHSKLISLPPLSENVSVVKVGDERQTRLVVHAVDTNNFSTDLIANRITRAIAEMGSKHSISRFAVNMSFSLVPCSVLADYRASGFGTFEEYVTKVAKKARLDFGPTFEVLITPVNPNSDPLYQLIQASTPPQPCDSGGPNNPGGSGGGGTVAPGPPSPGPTIPPTTPPDDCDDQEPGSGSPVIVYVASAGNYQRDYAMYPAAYPEVIGVSASDVTTKGGKADFSNSAEVTAAGAWYNLAGPKNEVVYAGTSFAAPYVTLFTAIDLTRKSPLEHTKSSYDQHMLCWFNSNVPQLAHHADYERAVLLDPYGYYTPPPYDAPLPEAIATFCSP